MKIRTIRYILLSVISILVLYSALGFGKRSFEAYCPFGGMESIWGLFKSGEFSCALGPLNLSMLIAVLILTVIAKKSFCGWICPIGFLSELGGRLGSKIWPKRPEIGAKLNGILKLLRYPALIAALYFTYRTGELILRGYDPFYIIFSGFGHGTLGLISYIVLGLLVIGSLVIPMFFCRYLCPLGAVFDPFSRLGLIKLTRDADSCTGCGECDSACPHQLKPQRWKKIRHRDCTNCLECLEACPEKEVMDLKITI
ncbi:4Fe-4S binding protein [bacterium]|nr:4Fe-4S binding protein [FCB group bacterium]MBL7190896.1 4Fe-4S binding protein [bacterium]